MKHVSGVPSRRTTCLFFQVGYSKASGTIPQSIRTSPVIIESASLILLYVLCRLTSPFSDLSTEGEYEDRSRHPCQGAERVFQSVIHLDLC